MENTGIQPEVPSHIKKESINLKSIWENIYYIKIKEEEYIVRPLTRKEFVFIAEMQSYTPNLAEELALDMCVLYPEIKEICIDDMLAGSVVGLTTAIIDLSGFNSPETLSEVIEENRESMNLVDNQMTTLICRAFPRIKPEDLGEFDIQKLCYHLALAEQILGVSLEFKPKTLKGNDPTIRPPKVIDFNTDNKELNSI